MSTSVIDFKNQKRRRRTEYSKRGCRECKRRKIKCDEAKPSCWQCERLNKLCLYPEIGEKVPRVSLKQLKTFKSTKFPDRLLSTSSGDMLAADLTTQHAPQPPPPIAPHRPAMVQGYQLPPMVPTVAVQNYRTPASSISNLLNDSKLPVFDAFNRNNTSPSSVSLHIQDLPNPSLFNTPQTFQAANSSMSNESILLGDNYQFFNHEDLNVLATDLNNIVTDIMFAQNYTHKRDDSEKTPSPKSDTPAQQSAPLQVERNFPLSYIHVTKSHERLYLEEFYNEFANVILPFNSYDNTTKSYFNPARDILLKCASNEPFLLAAILAQGAKSAFTKNNLPEDEEAYCSYLSRCLKLLGPALGKSTANPPLNSSLASNIELVLLTVLLLTSSNASNTKQNWRPHLRGAKDLLLKKTQNKSSFRDSKVMVFCKFWYISIEILAGLSSKIGGTLKSNHEIDLLITAGDKHEIGILKELGLILDNGFNLLGGYHYTCVLHLRDLIKLLNVIRSEGTYNPSNTFEYIRLLAEFHEQSRIVFYNKKCILSTTDFKDGVVPSGHLLDVTTVQSEKIVISWMDLSQQLYVLAATITLLTKCFQMSYNSPQVQELTRSLILHLSFLGDTSETPRLMKCSIMMIQWPMLVAGMNCVQENHKFLTMKFFRSAAHIGSGSAGFALRKISKIWAVHESGKELDSEDENAIDVVLY